MGAADVVPGVSGGTMALIMGIYERLILALRSLAHPPFLRALSSGRLRQAFTIVDGTFLVALAAGIATSVLSLAHVLSRALETHQVFVYGFFFGLILASVVLVGGRIERRSAGRWVLFAASALVTFLLVGVTPATTPEASWFLFLSGAVAISALLLPGISGAFVLVLLGKYETVLDALSGGDLAVLAPVALGAASGLLSVTQLLGWLFRHFRDTTLTVLCGVMLGSLRKVWPWQAELGGEAILLPPGAAWSATDGSGWALLLALAGAGLVWMLDRVGSEHEQERADD